MGANSVKEQLYNAVESSDEQEVARIIKENPPLLNASLTDDCKSTALSRAVWRNDKKLVTLILGMGSKVNSIASRGITPLMWAAKRGHLELAKQLLENGANVLQRSEDELSFTALEHAIVMGQYEMCLYLLSLDLTQLESLQTYEVYQNGAKGRYLSYCNYEQFVDHLKARIPLDSCPNFFQRPPQPELIDPVIDPRETWVHFIKRNIEFEEPPMVERNDLPQTLQPQNRFMGKVRAYINGKSPYPASDKVKIEDQKGNLELQDPFMDNRVIDENQKIENRDAITSNQQSNLDIDCHAKDSKENKEINL